MNDLDYKISKLKNGVRVLSVPYKNTAVVTSLVLVGTGSHYEPANTAGISHFLEHLFFKGSKKYPSAAKISTILDGLGAEYNAFTGEEETGFYVKTVADKAELALDVMADYLKTPLFNEAEIERERGVILEELRMYKDLPQRHVFELLTEALYGAQPAGRNIGGDEKSVNNIKRNDIQQYFERQYRGDNIVAVFAGAVSHKQAKELAQKHFEDLPKGAPYDKQQVKPVAQNGPIAKIETRTTDQTHIAFGFEGPSMADDMRYAVDLLSVIMGGGMSSRLFTQVRERRGLAYYVAAGTNSGTDFGYFMARAGIANPKLKEAVRVIVGELKKIKRQAPLSAELKKAKNAIEGKTLLHLETSDEVASYLGAQEVLLNKMETPFEYLQKMKKVTAKDVKEAANYLFNKKKARLALIGPKQNKKQLEDILKTL